MIESQTQVNDWETLKERAQKFIETCDEYLGENNQINQTKEVK